MKIGLSLCATKPMNEHTPKAINDTPGIGIREDAAGELRMRTFECNPINDYRLMDNPS
jgi:hypothetical protein